MKRMSGIKRTVAERLALAPEAAGCTRLTMIDNTALCIENFERIVEYTQKRVRIHTGTHDILVRGSGLMLEDFGSGFVSVAGQIISVEYDGAAQ